MALYFKRHTFSLEKNSCTCKFIIFTRLHLHAEHSRIYAEHGFVSNFKTFYPKVRVQKIRGKKYF